MKFVYDVLLNFNDTNIYNFYEWSTEDDIEYFKKIPLFKANSDTYKKITIGSTINDKNFLDKIYNLTEIYDKKKIRRVAYASIITNGKEAVAILLNKNGNVMMLSKMLIDEEDETLDISFALSEQDFNIDTCNKSDSKEEDFLTRLERKKRFFLNKELQELYNTKNIVKLKYLYYECFNIIEEDVSVIRKKFTEFMESEWALKHDELYDLVRLSYSKK